MILNPIHNHNVKNIKVNDKSKEGKQNVTKIKFHKCCGRTHAHP